VSEEGKPTPGTEPGLTNTQLVGNSKVKMGKLIGGGLGKDERKEKFVGEVCVVGVQSLGWKLTTNQEGGQTKERKTCTEEPFV